jgi:uncharacterized protein (TIGR02246 family)
MRKWLVPVLLVAALTSAGRLTAAAQQHPLQTLDEAWMKAAKAGDVAAITALYAPDAVIYPPDAMEVRGTEAIRKSWEGLFKTVTVNDGKIEAVYETTGNISVGWGRFSMTVTPKAGGPQEKWEGRAMSVAKKINGKWLYVADHASMPMPPPPGATKSAP